MWHFAELLSRGAWTHAEARDGISQEDNLCTDSL